jgi:biofilm PGA synthesis N-glycosyltransferase PgaC
VPPRPLSLVPSPLPDYVLVTPVRDEEKLIGATIASVVAQTHRPREWIIVSDGSTDGTNGIVEAAARAHPWIRLLALPPRAGRDFAAVVKNTERGVRTLEFRDYGFLGLLDSDVTFQSDYFEQLIRRFETNPRLGLAGGVVIDIGTPRDRLPYNRQDVPGAVQFFRRACFESLGGLIAIPEGGWDALTCAVARMRGYETRLFTDLVVDHHKPRNIAHGGQLRRKWQLGVRDYCLGYHPLFEFVKCCGKLHHHPFLLGAAAWWLGYCAAVVRRHPRLIPDDLVRFVRSEQSLRLRRVFSASPPAADR